VGRWLWRGSCEFGFLYFGREGVVGGRWEEGGRARLWRVEAWSRVWKLIDMGNSIHNLGKVGHIEDIAVAKDQQGKKLGLRIIQALDYISEKVGCYKVRL